MMTILGDPGADGGARESRSGRKQKVGEEKSRAKAFTFALDFSSPHYLLLGLQGCMMTNCLQR